MKLRTVASLLAAALVVASAWACSSSAGSTPKGVCPPGKSVFCRCQDRSEGSKTCNDDGSGYSPCDPCIGGELIEDDGGGFEPFDSGEPADSGTPTGCGNGTIEPGEQCDDKNTKSGDGCSSSCKPDGNPESARTCPGMPIDVWDVAVDYDGTTATYSTTFKAQPACGPDGGATAAGSTAPDRVFKVTPHKTGTLTISVSKPAFDVMIYASATCAPDMVHAGACTNARTGTGDETLSVPVTDGKGVYVVVDGAAANQSGAFHVRFAVN